MMCKLNKCWAIYIDRFIFMLIATIIGSCTPADTQIEKNKVNRGTKRIESPDSSNITISIDFPHNIKLKQYSELLKKNKYISQKLDSLIYEEQNYELKIFQQQSDTLIAKIYANCLECPCQTISIFRGSILQKDSSSLSTGKSIEPIFQDLVVNYETEPEFYYNFNGLTLTVESFFKNSSKSNEALFDSLIMNGQKVFKNNYCNLNGTISAIHINLIQENRNIKGGVFFSLPMQLSPKSPN